MGKPSKQDHDIGKSINSYERCRMLRIQENQARLKQSGILNITKTLTSLGKTRLNLSCNDKDIKYSPDVDGVDEEVSENEIDKGAELRQKVTRGYNHRYIPPQSMTKRIALAKQKNGVHDQLGRYSKNKSQQVVNKVGTTLSMAELILRKKQSNVQYDSLHVPSTFEASVSTRRKLFSEGDNTGAKESELEAINDFQEVDGTEEDGNEDCFDLDSESMHCENGESESMDLEELETNGPGEKAISEKKARGPTMMHNVHTRLAENRKAIILNEFGQPVGPVTPQEDTVGEFSRFLGTLARDYGYAPLIHKSWYHVPNKDKMWEYVLGKYMVPEEGKSWVLKTIGAAWRIHKCRFKRKHYYHYKDNKARWKNRSQRLPDEDFMKLMELWNKKEEKNRCSINRECRKSQKNMHTAGPKSFVVIREQMIYEDPNKQPPTLAQLFERTRMRKEGNVYKESYENTLKKIEAMKSYKPSEDGSGFLDAFEAVMEKEYNGRRRIYGKGVTNRVLKKVNGCGTSHIVPEEVMESFKADVEAEKIQLVEMRKELEADYLKKKAELEAEHAIKIAELESMKNDFDTQKETMKEAMAEDVMQKLISKLPPEIVNLLARV